MAKETVAVLGAGHIGGTLGKKWSAAGYQVRFGVKDPNGKNAQAIASEPGNRATIGTIEEALQGDPDVVLIAVPGGAVEAVAQDFGAHLNGRIVIDAANRMGEDSMHNLAYFQQHAPQAKLYRAFNSLGWENFEEPHFNGVQADLFYCGPDGEARAVVEQLIAAVGLRPVYLGGNEQMGLLDSIASLMTLTLIYGKHSWIALFKRKGQAFPHDPLAVNRIHDHLRIRLKNTSLTIVYLHHHIPLKNTKWSKRKVEIWT